MWRTILALVVATPLAAPVSAPGRPSGRGNVVLVHGCWDDSRMFDPMRRVLEGAGYTCYAPDLSPKDGSGGIRVLTRQLAAGIDARFGPSVPVALVGFSMGGIVVRDYVQNVVADRRRVRGVFLISSGARGTLWANLSPKAGQRQMAVGSPFLRSLNADAAVWKTVPLHSYWTPFDLMIMPAALSRWPTQQSQAVFCPAHRWMVRNREVISDIQTRLGQLSAVQPAG